MSSHRRILKNLSYLSISEVVSKVIILFIFVLLANYLGNELFGQFSYGFAFAMIAVVLVDLGLNYLNVIEIAQDKKIASKLLIHSFVLKIPFFVATTIVIIFALQFINFSPEKILVIIILCLYTFIKSFSELSFAIFRAFERMEYDSSLKIFRNVLLILLILILIKAKANIGVLVATFPVVELITFIISLCFIYTRFIPVSLDLDWKYMKKLFWRTAPFSGTVLIGAIYFYLSSIILSQLKGDAALGIFSASYNLVLGISFIPQIYTGALFPVLSRVYKRSLKTFTFVYTKSMKYLWIIGLPVGVGAYVLAQKIILTFYNQGYVESAVVLQILAIFIPLKFLNYLMGSVLSVAKNQPKRLFCQGITALASVLFSFLFIPLYSFKGAALAVILAELLLLGLYFVYTSKILGFHNFLPMMVKPCLAALCMAVVLILIKLNLFLEIVIGAIVYFLVLFFLKSYDHTDKEILEKILKKQDIKE
ncbi:MAG: oligosaccharide flippase family protein [Candidatus Woesearchaeota archaeon]|jgi:O-antigen/teichoic acid export membrane protein|nr:oligosaccharide flippase family protein [Candidatus Woesearchaeota archaeon]MDP7457195.1 oligosaccharide flippase family protein [Candidatus Woesearchaeota archaeon]